VSLASSSAVGRKNARSEVRLSGARWSNYDDVNVHARKPSNGSPTTKPVPSSG
jgi:hypothetical protein